MTSRRSASGLVWRLWPIAVAWLALALLTGYAHRPPRPRRFDAATSEFSQARAAKILAALARDGQARTPGSEADGGGLARLSSDMMRIGIRPQLQETFTCSDSGCGHVRNLVARIEGREPGCVLLVAHHDSVGAGPGASDDGVGWPC
jgi:hypothetical protein